ncbi:hypothetical protein K1T71_004930 [Dendrolimus kikuchii]|uniref:Uncharacterized protein n=1 Tax=Dendrolimus kikuchii TaxID=765133 RepID=A0ACC1D6K0_9NEOP|nr:hypothetical protein K1T71_004930 [Dendrolimus kikuchii]
MYILRPKIRAYATLRSSEIGREGGISDELKPHLQVALQKLKALEELTINSENQYIKKTASLTGVSQRTNFKSD